MLVCNKRFSTTDEESSHLEQNNSGPEDLNQLATALMLNIYRITYQLLVKIFKLYNIINNFTF
jgi:hypothetical protein